MNTEPVFVVVSLNRFSCVNEIKARQMKLHVMWDLVSLITEKELCSIMSYYHSSRDFMFNFDTDFYFNAGFSFADILMTIRCTQLLNYFKCEQYLLTELCVRKI